MYISLDLVFIVTRSNSIYLNETKKTSHSDRILVNIRSKFFPLFTGIYFKLFTENIWDLIFVKLFCCINFIYNVQTGIIHYNKNKNIQ